MAGFYDNTYNPDVLLCLANLSNDEVFTPPDVANQILDMLPQELFSDPNTKFLDPACKSGVFLREIAKRLIVGLANTIPDLQERIDHIMHKQLYAIAITELTAMLSRRSVYCSKFPNGPFSISHFETAQGNIKFHKISHTWKDGKCVYCGASQSEYDRDADLETHAYEFIHFLKPEEIFNMKFDVIVSNPPYQISDGGNNASASPLYNFFVEQAKKLRPRYMTMIIPARWYAGGKGLDEFRKSMLTDKRVVRVVDYVNAKDCFPGTSIGGGVCYFLWDRDNPGMCEYTNIHDGEKSTATRNLEEYPVFVRYNEAISIIHKVVEKEQHFVSEVIGARNPYGLSSSTRGSNEGDCVLYSSGGTGRIPMTMVKQGLDTVGKYKVMISKVTAEHAGEPDKSGKFTVVSTTKVLAPNEVCTDSYLVAYSTTSKEEAVNFASYMCTKFFRFLLLQAVSSINLSKDKFQFVPMQDFSKKMTDEELYRKYNLSESEISFIEAMIKPKTLGGDV